MTWDTVAHRILIAATSAGVPVAREFVAPGPQFARDCRLIAVCMIRPAVVPLQREYAGACAVVPQHTFQVVFAADCVPTQDDDGKPPPAADVTMWSLAFLRDAGLIYDAVLEAAVNGDISGSCESVSVGQGEMRGPQGSMASLVFPLTVQFIE